MRDGRGLIDSPRGGVLARIVIQDRSLEVSKQVAAMSAYFHAVRDVCGAWSGTINGQPQQLLVVTTADLSLGLNSGIKRLPWSEITTISPHGLTTADATYEVDVGPLTQEVLAWIAEFFCPEARRVSLGASEGHVPYLARSEEWRRARNRKMTDALRETSGKWRNALEGNKFNLVSIMGTGDWEDYASSSIAAMQLEAVTDLSERVERLEVLLTQIRDILVDQRAPRSE